MSKKELQEIAKERAQSMYKRNWAPEMAKYKTFGISEEQKDEFIMFVVAEFEKLID